MRDLRNNGEKPCVASSMRKAIGAQWNSAEQMVEVLN